MKHKVIGGWETPDTTSVSRPQSRRFCIIAFICVALAAVADAAPDRGKKPLTDAERAARREAVMRRTGGPFTIPASGFVQLVDYQRRADFAKLARKFEETFSGFNIPARAIQATNAFCIASMKTLAHDMGAGAVVAVVDDPALPMSLVSIETRCGLVNVAALAADTPSPALLTRRTGKVVGRVAMLASGGAESDSPSSSLKTVTSLKELDASEGIGDEAYVMMGVIRGMAKAGVHPSRVTSYRQACRMGIAPAPTNDVQRAVWEKVHSEKERGPSHGLKISP